MLASATSSTDFLSVSSNATDPYFNVPPGFRTNSIFVGMQKELDTIEEKLFVARREIGTSCVLLHGQPGAGKSHLVRQYVYMNRQKFGGGIFWINACLIGEVENEFWQIAQRVVAKVSPELITSIQEPNRQYVDAVREWFESREEWLIILDGIAAESDHEIERLHRFIPDSKNSSIIYVSRSGRFEAMHRLLDPIAVKVHPLKEAESLELLFKELHIEKPRQAQITSATSLVSKFGGLPLAISAIARRIADTRIPIEKYSMKSYSEDPKLSSTYRHIMDDLRKNRHPEALNLISILCFFGPHIPVEMIHLGCGALSDVKLSIRSGEGAEDPDLNTTLDILMQHALIERNEPDDNSSMASSRDTLQDPEPIDILKMHRVIQRFCADSLHSSKELPIWLGRAVKLFIHSYHEADSRIRSRREPARLSDYRQYSIHGEQLRQYTRDYDTRRQSLKKIRKEVEQVLGEINERIRSLEVNSSRESIVHAEQQTSIFDRTNNSSSGNSQLDNRSPTYSSPSHSREELTLGAPLSLPAARSPTTESASSAPRNFVDTTASQQRPIAMRKTASDTPTIRPYEQGFITNGQVNMKPPSPVTKTDTEAALATLSSPTNGQELPDAHNLLSNLRHLIQPDQAPSQPQSQATGSFWSPLPTRGFWWNGGFSTISPNDLATPVLVSDAPPRIASAPVQGQSAYAAPQLYTIYSQGATDSNVLRNRALRSPSRSKFVLAKSPLAPTVISPVDDSSRWNSHDFPFPVNSTAGNVLPIAGLAQSSIGQQVILEPHQVRLPYDGNTALVTNPWSGESFVAAAPPAQKITATSLAQTQSHGITLQPNISQTGTRQTQSRLQQMSHMPHQSQLSQHVQQSPQFAFSSQSTPPSKHLNTHWNSNVPDASSRVPSITRSELAPSSPTTNQSGNASPTASSHLFNSMHSDVTPTAYVYVNDPFAGQLMPPASSLVAVDSTWPQQPTLAPNSHSSSPVVLSPQNQPTAPRSAPMTYRPFSPSLYNMAMRMRSQSPASSASASPLSLAAPTAPASSPMSPPIPQAESYPHQIFTNQPTAGPGVILDGGMNHGLGIAEFGNLANDAFSAPNSPPPFPFSDTRYRLRKREGRARDLSPVHLPSPLTRKATEIEHPLAPTEKASSEPGSPRPSDGASGGWRPIDRNVGTRSSAPYPEIDTMPSEGASPDGLALASMVPGVGLEAAPGVVGARRRNLSAPESPAWDGPGSVKNGWFG